MNFLLAIVFICAVSSLTAAQPVATFSIGTGGIGGAGAPFGQSAGNGTSGGSTTISFQGFSITATGGEPGLANINNVALGGSFSGSTGVSGINGGNGLGASGDNGGGGGGGLGNSSMPMLDEDNGGDGATAVFVSLLSDILNSRYGLPMGGLGGNTSNVEATGMNALGWGSGGGGGGWFGGRGGDGSIGGGGGAGAGGFSGRSSTAGGNGGQGLVVFAYKTKTSSSAYLSEIITTGSSFSFPTNTFEVVAFAIGGGGGGGGATEDDSTSGGGAGAGALARISVCFNGAFLSNSVCTLCAAGTYQDGINQAVCLTCPQGQTSTQGSSSCTTSQPTVPAPVRAPSTTQTPVPSPTPVPQAPVAAAVSPTSDATTVTAFFGVLVVCILIAAAL